MQTRVFADPTELRRILHVLQDIAFQFRENNSLTESVLDKWNIFLRDNLISTDPQQRCSATPVKRGKGKKSRAKHSPTSTQSTTPPGSKDNVSSRSSISRLKRAFGITHKKSQHAQTAWGGCTGLPSYPSQSAYCLGLHTPLCASSKFHASYISTWSYWCLSTLLLVFFGWVNSVCFKINCL